MIFLNKYPQKNLQKSFNNKIGLHKSANKKLSPNESQKKLELRIWELVDGSRKVSEIIQELQNDITIEKNTIFHDTCAFINKLSENKLIIFSDIPVLNHLIFAKK